MSKRILTEDYTWNEFIYNSLLQSQKDGDILAVGLFHFGKIISVDKIEEENIIRVSFEKVEMDEKVSV